MSDFLTQHWLLVAAAFLSGLLVKWLLDLFFLRRSIFDTREQLSTRERQLTDARHEQARTSETLKNRLIELDSTSKAKLAAEALAARRARELEAAAEEVAGLRQQLERETARSAALSERVSMLEIRLDRSSTEISQIQSRSLDLSLRLAEAEATVVGQAEALAELRAIRESLTGSRDAVFARLLDAEAGLAAQQEVHLALQDALLSRDTTIAGQRSQLASLDLERRSVADLLAARDAEAGRLADSLAHLSPLKPQLAAAEASLAKIRTQLDSATRVRDESEAALKRRDHELTEWERKAQEYQSAFDDAARENSRISQELARITAQASGASAALKQAEAAKASSDSRLAALAAENTALRKDLESGDTASGGFRDELQRAKSELSAATAARTATESELAAVSESHAQLEAQLVEARQSASRAEELAEQLGTVEAELAVLRALPREPAPAELETVLNDLDQVIRERNGLAAELALLRSKSAGDI